MTKYVIENADAAGLTKDDYNIVTIASAVEAARINVNQMTCAGQKWLFLVEGE